MSVLKHRQPLAVVLCLSVLAGSTSTSIHHRHEHGSVPHTHGFGIVRSFNSTAAREDAPPTGQIASYHGHLVMFGIEFYVGESSPRNAPPRSIWTLDGTRVMVGLEQDPLLKDPDCSVASLPPLTSVLLPVAGQTACRLVSPEDQASPSARCALCDCARGERSGVRLA